MIRADLIAKLEAATEGSREFDLAIWNAVSKDPPWRFLDERNETITCDRYGPGAAGNPVVSLDRFTRSIAAALTLVPPGWQWEVRSIPTDEGINHSAEVNWKPEGRQYGQTPAIALCIAALRATETDAGS